VKKVKKEGRKREDPISLVSGSKPNQNLTIKEWNNILTLVSVSHQPPTSSFLLILLSFLILLIVKSDPTVPTSDPAVPTSDCTILTLKNGFKWIAAALTRYRPDPLYGFAAAKPAFSDRAARWRFDAAVHFFDNRDIHR